MKIGVLGSGAVGVALAKGFVAEGHEVWIATREPAADKSEQLKHDVPGATVTDFATAAKGAELAVFCVKWEGAQEMIGKIGPENLASKVVIDTSNVIKMDGQTLVYGGMEQSAASQLQAWLPDSKVVKAFNTVGAAMMYKPQFDVVPTMFVAGDDAAAKQQVSDIASSFGWEAMDAGGLLAAHELEAMAIVWIRNSLVSGAHHAFKML